MAQPKSSWIREYEQITSSASSRGELKALSVQYISQQRDELSNQVEQCKNEADKNLALAESRRGEVDRLRDALKRLQTELEVRQSRIPRSDKEDFRAIVTQALCEQPAAPPGELQEKPSELRSESDRLRSKAKEMEACRKSDLPVHFELRSSSPEGVSLLADSSSANVMKRLRARVERLERENKRLEKESEHLKLDLMLSSRELKSKGALPTSTTTGPSMPSRSRRSSGTAARSPKPSPKAISPRILAVDKVNDSEANTSQSSSLPKAAIEDREKKLAGERDQLLSMVSKLEKEQAEHQQYADQVVSQLGTALRSLEADNASLHTERRANEQKIEASLEARKKLERQVKQLKAENEALIQRVVGARSDKPGEKRKAAPSSPKQSARSSRSSSPSRTGRAEKPAEKPAAKPVEKPTASRRSSPDAAAVPVKAATEVSDPAPEPSMQSFLAADLASATGSVRKGFGVAWQPVDGSIDASPLAESPASVILEQVPSMRPAQVEQPKFSSAGETVVPSSSRIADSGPLLTTPAWAVVGGSPADGLPRVMPPRRLIDMRERQGLAGLSPPLLTRPTSGNNLPAVSTSTIFSDATNPSIVVEPVVVPG